MFGFFAFNGGSRASISVTGDGKVVARAMTNTMLCGGWAAITVLLANKLFAKHSKWSLLLSINAVLAGEAPNCTVAHSHYSGWSFDIGYRDGNCMRWL